jgi:KUP system potassium uptake protein
MYSILYRKPKRAEIYWFIHVETLDDPYTCEYKVEALAPNRVIRVDFRFGFRVAQRMQLMFRRVVQDLVVNAEVDLGSRYKSLQRNNELADFQFVVLEKVLSYDNDLPFRDRLIMRAYFFLKHISLSEERGFGLDPSFVTVEKFPLMVSPAANLGLKRVP